MASRTISTRLAIEGEGEYRAALKNINAELALHKSELQKVEAQYKTNQNSVEALEAKQAALKGVLDALNQKHQEQAAMAEQARAAQQKYAQEAEQLRTRLDALKNSTSGNAEEEKKLTEQLAAAEAKMQKAKNAANGYQTQVNKTEKEQATLNAELEQCAEAMDKLGSKTGSAAEKARNANETLNALTAALLAAGLKRGVQDLTQAVRDCVDASVEFESAMAGVYKTVDGTPEELAALSDGIKEMSTQLPATTTEIAAVAEAAGQLGIATQDVLGFTRVMLDLGESTNLSAQEAASSLAKFANITGTAADDYERLGSVIVGLGNNLAATEADIVSMATRLASAGKLAGLTEAEIMALSAAMSSVGIEAEAGGTAMTQTLTALEKAVTGGGERLEQFARIAGMSAAQFSTAWREDAMSAVQAFISGLGRLDAQGESAALALDELGLSGVRQSNMLKSLALASDTLTGAVSLANQAWAENTALAEEAGKRYETTESKLAMLSNSFTNVKAAIGGALTPALRGIAEAGAGAFSWAADFIEQNPWLVQAIAGATTAVIAFTSALTAMTVISKLTAMVEGATGALSAMGMVLAAHPIAAAVSAFAGLTVAVGAFLASASGAVSVAQELNDKLSESRSVYQETTKAIQDQSGDTLAMVRALQELAEAEQKTAAQKASILELVVRLNEAVPDLNLAYDEQADKLNLTTQALERLALAQAEQAKLEAKREYLSELYAQRAKAVEALEAAQEALTQAEAEQTRIEAELAETEKELGYLSVEESGARDSARIAAQACRDTIAALNTTMEEQNGEIARAEAEYNALTAALDGAASATEGYTGAAQGSCVELVTLSDLLEQVSGGYALLVKAQEETAQSGNLSLSTLQSLLSKYPELERYLVETADGYALVQGAVEDYVTAQRAEYQLVYDNAYAAAQDVVDAEVLKANGYDATTMSIKEQLRAMRELYTAQATAAQNAVLERYGGDTSDYAARQAMDNDPTARSAINTALAAQQALNALEAAGKNLGAYNRAAATAARSTGGGGSKSGGAKTAAQDALAELEDWLADMDHQIFLWSKDESKTEAVIGLYRQMQERAHAAAEQLRTEGYDETSDEIQKLQTLWWGYSDEISGLWETLYEREREALERAHGEGRLSTQEYLDGLLALQSKYFSEDSAAWTGAEKDRKALAEKFAQEDRKAKESAYSEALADAKYFRDLNLISEREYYAELERLRDTYLEKNSSAWRSATVELYNYQRKCLETALEELETAYQSKLKDLQSDLDQQLKALDAQLKAAQSAQKAAYQAQKDAAKGAYEEKKAAVQAELALEQERLNAILDGINAEIQARRELREDESQDDAVAKARKRLEAAQAQLAYARTGEDRAQWEKEVVRLQEALDKAVQDKEDTAFYRQKELEKEQVNGELSAAKDAAAQKQDEVKADYDQKLKELEADYSAAMAKLEAEYAAQKARAEEQYAAQKARAEQNYQAAAGELRGSSAQQSLQDWQAAQVAAFNAAAGGGSAQRSKQTEASRAAAKAKADALDARGLSNALARVMSTAAVTAAKQVQNVVTKNSSASVTIHQASSLTEGQVERTVKKVLDQLDR